MYNLAKPGYDLETMRAVAAAYRRESQAGGLDELRNAGMAEHQGTAMRLVSFGLTMSVLVLAMTGAGIRAAHAANPDALWKIVHDRCVVNQTQHGNPEPCARVELGSGEARGYVILKDNVGATHFLLIPTARISGIESPAILAPGATNYFAEAWHARSFVEERLGHFLPRNWVSLAINSMVGRSQNQLHIHIDCVRADVRDLLNQHAVEIGTTSWTPLSVPLAGHRYSAIAIAGKDLDTVNLVALLADRLAGARDDMGHETLVAVGVIRDDGEPGFIILADHADPAVGDRARGEELQDHSCAAIRD